jgi:hypothetical protein
MELFGALVKSLDLSKGEQGGGGKTFVPNRFPMIEVCGKDP